MSPFGRAILHGGMIATWAVLPSRARPFERSAAPTLYRLIAQIRAEIVNLYIVDNKDKDRERTRERERDACNRAFVYPHYMYNYIDMKRFT